MRKDLTEIVFIIDRSGSMAGLEADTIGGYNALIQKQKQEPGEARLTTVLFDDQYEVIHDGVNIHDVPEITHKEYWARGLTAMMDAIGYTINSVGKRLAATPEDKRPSKVLFVITTDGHENASKEFDRAQVKAMIEHQTSKYNWEFMFLGANIDAVETANTLGINSDCAANYCATSAGTDSLYVAVSKAVSSYRSGELDASWSVGLDMANSNDMSAKIKIQSAQDFDWNAISYL